MTPAPPPAVTPDGSTRLEALLERVAAEREALQARLLETGALLFRGWALSEPEHFARFVRAFSGDQPLFNYAGGASPRNALETTGLYTSTEYPPHVALSLHNELSYADVQPRRLFFFCQTAAQTGGETTLADSRRILRAIDPAVVEAFRRRGVRYLRNLSPERGGGYSWREAFETDDPVQAEAGCRRIGAQYAWLPDGTLRLHQVRPATAVHPDTGEEVWFNQADGFHPSALDPETYSALLAHHGSEDRFRLNAAYGDGAPIEPAALEGIRAALRAETVPHRWRPGDVVVLDNLLAAHGRNPFSGPRKILLAMT
ncbi:MAG: TauD/TfdA family dioxygenase [Proteobacteria bacterium]|nr:TauD/TfdA family dioxygenase [Pseudomonadota bacterium]